MAAAAVVLAHAHDPSSPAGTTRTANAAADDSLWNTPNDSVFSAPETVVEEHAPDAGARTPLRVVTLADQDGTPVLTTTRVTGTAAAERAVAAAQDTTKTVAVSVDSPVTIPDEPHGPAGETSFGTTTGVTAAAESGTTTAGAAWWSNDTFRTDQWALNTLKGESVWKNASGTGAVVAVIDTGVSGTHPDLAGQLLPGAEFIRGGGLSSTGNGQVDPHGHGTHVAGIIAAVKGNNLGVAGLAPTAKILPVRVLDAAGSGWNSDVAAGILWATDHGAQIINMSLGGSADSATQAAVEYAVNHGVLVIAAAGNDRASGSPTSYPGAYPGVLAVAATTATNSDASYSNIGSYVDIAAPGSSILSTVPDGYGTKSGTSMATPYVAAAAADLYDVVDGTLSANHLAAVLANTATDLGAPGRDSVFGAGLVNPLAAVCAYTTCAGAPALPPSVTPDDPAPAPGTGTGTADRAATMLLTPNVDSYVWYRGTVTASAQLVLAGTGTPLAHQPVAVTGYQGARPTLSKVVYTDAAGRISLRWALSRSTVVKVSFAATARYQPAAGTVGTFRVLPRVRATYTGHRATVKVNPRAGQRVKFQKYTRHRWVTRAVVKPDRLGVAHAPRLGKGTWRATITRVTGLENIATGSWRVR